MRSPTISTASTASPQLTVRLLSVAEACSFLGIKRTQFYKLLGQGRLNAVKLGRRTLVRTDELQRFIDALATSPTRRGPTSAVEVAR